MSKELRDLHYKAQREFDNVEPIAAPSGEWAEYNVEYIKLEATSEALEEALYACGQCGECKNADARNQYQIFCNRLQLVCSVEWGCQDFERNI